MFYPVHSIWKNLLKAAAIPVLCLLSWNAAAQEDSLSEMKEPGISSLGDLLLPAGSPINISGYYRFLGYRRLWKEPLVKNTDPKQVISVGDFYREPMLLLSLTANPSHQIYVGTNFFVFHNYRGPELTHRDGDSLSLSLGVSLHGGITTSKGNYYLQAGGIIWYSLSPFTLWLNQTPYNRFSIFDRNPWEPVSGGNERYRSFYNEGKVLQDARWNKQAFQGIIVDGVNLPGKFSFSLLYGKTINNGGVSSYSSLYKPSLAFGGKLTKNFNQNFISLNSLYSFSHLDSLHTAVKSYGTHSVEYKFGIKGVELSGEAGIGSYESPTFLRQSSPGFMVKAVTPKAYTFLPMEFSWFWIGKNMVNVNSGFMNTYIPEAWEQNISAGGGTIFPFYSPVIEIGQFTNNRRGFSFNSSFKIKNLKVDFGNAVSSEITPSFNVVSYQHRINGLALSRIYNFSWMPAAYGPYSNLTSVFRGYYERVTLSDTTTAGEYLHRKHFNTFELQARYKLVVSNKPVYFHYLGSYNTVQKNLYALPGLAKDPYLRIYYHEFELFIPILSRLTWVCYYGIERINGNSLTDRGDVPDDHGGLKFRKQKGEGIGTGFDLDLGTRAGLFFRHRWFSQKDPHFSQSKFKGQEATLELKIFFN